MNGDGRFGRREMMRSLVSGSLVMPAILTDALAVDAARDVAANPLAPKAPHFPGRAKRVIFLFMTGAVSHVDTFDHKPYLTQHHNEKANGNRYYKGADWKFKPYGESGIEVSDLFPHIGSVIDEVCLSNSMKNLSLSFRQAAATVT